jgi:hypothetical protein
MNIAGAKFRRLTFTTLTYQFIWAALWVMFLAVMESLRPGGIGPGEGWAITKVLGLLGLGSGIGFSLLLVNTRRICSPQAIPWGLGAVYGFLPAAFLPLLVGKFNQMPVMGAAGVVTGLALAAVSRYWKRTDCATC